MTIEIVSSSPKALAAAKQGVKNNPLYPFDKLEAGQSFTLPVADCNLVSLQVIASRKSRNGKRFKVIRHDELNLVEVARVS